MPTSSVVFHNSPIHLYRCGLFENQSNLEEYQAQIHSLSFHLAQMGFTHLLGLPNPKNGAYNYCLEDQKRLSLLVDSLSQYGIGLILHLPNHNALRLFNEYDGMNSIQGVWLSDDAPLEHFKLEDKHGNLPVLNTSLLTDASRLNKGDLSPIAPSSLSQSYRSFYSYDDLFSFLRARSCAYMSLPGIKITNVGDDIAQFDPCSTFSQLQSFLLDYPKHREFRRFISELNFFYLTHSQLWETNISNEKTQSFANDSSDLFSVSRYNQRGECIVCVANLTDSTLEGDVFTDAQGPLLPVFASDMGITEQMQITQIKGKATRIRLPRFSSIYLKENYVQSI